MDEPTWAQCRKCGAEFTTRASTRTRCPDCRAAVTVRRERDSTYEDGGEGPAKAWAAAISTLIGLGLVFFRIFKGPGDHT